MTVIELALFKEMQRKGLQPSVPLVADGELHRIADNRDRRGKKDIWYVLYDDGYPAAWFGHHSRLQETQKWELRQASTLTPEEREIERLLIEDRRKEQELSLEERRANCRAKAVKYFEWADDPSPDNEYLVRKNVKAYGIKEVEGMLFIPLYKNGIMTGLQFIKSNGAKTFLSGTEKSGAYFTIPGEGKKIYLAEGYSTAASVHEITGGTVVVAFDCGNLMAVAKTLRKSHPSCELIICADNDRNTPGNPGVTKAMAAAAATGAKLAIPTFPGDEGTDFNDLVAICGAGGVPCL